MVRQRAEAALARCADPPKRRRARPSRGIPDAAHRRVCYRGLPGRPVRDALRCDERVALVDPVAQDADRRLVAGRESRGDPAALAEPVARRLGERQHQRFLAQRAQLHGEGQAVLGVAVHDREHLLRDFQRTVAPRKLFVRVRLREAVRAQLLLRGFQRSRSKQPRLGEVEVVLHAAEDLVGDLAAVAQLHDRRALGAQRRVLRLVVEAARRASRRRRPARGACAGGRCGARTRRAGGRSRRAPRRPAPSRASASISRRPASSAATRTSTSRASPSPSRAQTQPLHERDQREPLAHQRDEDDDERDEHDRVARRERRAALRGERQRERGGERHDAAHPRPADHQQRGRATASDRARASPGDSARGTHAATYTHSMRTTMSSSADRERGGQQRERARAVLHERAQLQADREEDERVDDVDPQRPHVLADEPRLGAGRSPPNAGRAESPRPPSRAPPTRAAPGRSDTPRTASR